MYSSEAVKAEVNYRRERLSRDFRRAGSKRRPLQRRSLVGRFTRNS